VNLGKTSRRKALFLGLLVAQVFPAVLHAQSLLLETRVDGNILTANFSVRDADRETIADNLRDGLRARVTFTLRLYADRDSFLSIGAARMTSEYEIEQTAERDPFADEVFLSTEVRLLSDRQAEPRRRRQNFSSVSGAVSALLTYEDLVVPLEGEHRVAARARIEEMLIVPALRITRLFALDTLSTTAWRQIDL
jgi:hypothetical protein